MQRTLSKQKLISFWSSTYNQNTFRVQEKDCRGFALDYRLGLDNLTLFVGEHALPIIHDELEPHSSGDVAEQMNVLARIGDVDDANLPWFPFADSVLLFWWIHKEHLRLPISVKWSREADGLHKMEIHAKTSPQNGLLLTVEIQGPNPSTISASAPELPLSSSPSLTYLVRVAIIHIIAPTAVFVNDLLGNAFGLIIETVVTALFMVLVISMYGFLILAVVFSLWSCFKGPSYEDTVKGIRSRLEKLSQNERLRYLKIDMLQENLELLHQNERFKRAVDICRKVWHPERDRAMAAKEQEADIEKSIKTQGRGKKAGDGDNSSNKQ